MGAGKNMKGGGGGGGGFTKKMMNPLKGGKELLEDGKTPAGKDVSRLVHDRSYFSNLVKSLLRLDSETLYSHYLVDNMIFRSSSSSSSRNFNNSTSPEPSYL